MVLCEVEDNQAGVASRAEGAELKQGRVFSQGQTLARCRHQPHLTGIAEGADCVESARYAAFVVRPPGLEPGTCRLRV